METESECNILSCSALLGRTGKLNLNTIDSIHTVDEEDEDEDKGDLVFSQHC